MIEMEIHNRLEIRNTCTDRPMSDRFAIGGNAFSRGLPEVLPWRTCNIAASEDVNVSEHRCVSQSGTAGLEGDSRAANGVALP